jgi:hypothetical protein
MAGSTTVFTPFPPIRRHTLYLFSLRVGISFPVSLKVAFKAMGADGLGKVVTGTLYDSTDREILTFKSFHLGMGFFHFLPDENESYYTICMNEQGITRRFDLPNPNPDVMVVTAQMS